MLLGLLAGNGCALRGFLSHHPSSPPATTAPRPTPSPHPKGKPKSGFRWNLFHRDPSPPKARILLEAGTVRSVSPDGSYAIVELAPGNAVPVGEILLAPSPSHPMATLRVTELQGTFVAAEITEGSVVAGDLVKH